MNKNFFGFICGLLIIILIIVVIFLIMCNNNRHQCKKTPVPKTILEKFIEDMQPMKDEIVKLDEELLTLIYTENINLINPIYSTTALRNNFKNVISDTQCIIEIIKIDMSKVSPLKPIPILKCINKTTKNIELWEKDIILRLIINIIKTLHHKLTPGAGSVVEF